MIHLAFFDSGLTVGEVAGLISGSLHSVQIILPLTWAIVLVGVIRNGTYTAATWSAISQQLQVTHWPLLLGSDSGVGNWWGRKRIEWSIFFFSVLGLLGTISITAAGFLTPKPLVESIRPSSKVEAAQFQYVPDLSFYGLGTLPRPDNPIRRVCGWNEYLDCPHSIYDDPFIRNQYAPNHTVVNSTLPLEVSQVFTSYTSNSTISSLMDIQYRNWYMWHRLYVDNGQLNSQGTFRPLQTFVLDNNYQVIEGVVVDAVNGGIGLRNHTVPIGLSLGAEWSEDLLWLEAETACTSTNLTLHFAISWGDNKDNIDAYLSDDGGFANISPIPPEPRWDQGGWREVNQTPDLKRRADVTAWWNNQLIAETLNISSSSLGNVFGDLSAYASLTRTTSLKIADIDGAFLNQAIYDSSGPAWKAFAELNMQCTGYNDSDPNTPSKAFIKCGYLYSTPFPSDPGNQQFYRADVQSEWSQQLYTCATAIKASVKNVTFHTNGSETLAGLSVTSIQPKIYGDGELPYWAVEKVNSSRYMIEDIGLFWGLIDQTNNGSLELEVQQAESIYLPPTTHGVTLDRIYDSFAGGSAFVAALEGLFDDAAAVTGSLQQLVPSYSGDTDYGMTVKWRNLSRTPEGAAQIINLIWTDIAASLCVGTKTGFENSEPIPNPKLGKLPPGVISLGTRMVRRNVRVIEYSDIRYAIPAFVAGGLLALGLLGSLVMLLSCIVSPRMLIHYLNQTSMGRTYTQAKLPGEDVDPAWTTEQWLEHAGELLVPVPKVRKKKARARSEPGRPSVVSHSLNSSLGGSSTEAITRGARSNRWPGPMYQSVHGFGPEDEEYDLYHDRNDRSHSSLQPRHPTPL